MPVHASRMGVSTGVCEWVLRSVLIWESAAFPSSLICFYLEWALGFEWLSGLWVAAPAVEGCGVDRQHPLCCTGNMNVWVGLLH